MGQGASGGNEMPTKKKTTTKKVSARRKATRKAAPRRASAKPARRHVRRRTPETLRLRTAAPGLTVNDLAQSLSWYRDTLGFVVKERWEHEGKLAGVELAAGSVSFYLMQDDWQKGRERVKGIGFRLYCTTAQDVDRLAALIRGRGGRLLEEPHDEPWGGRALAVADPDGFKLTIASE
jgi:lactoylglutathione lyase